VLGQRGSATVTVPVTWSPSRFAPRRVTSTTPRVPSGSGPGGILRSVSIRLGAPNYPDDVMTFTGSVSALHGPEPDGTRGVVEVTLRGANRLGDHVTGTVTVALPR
jgi:hypothetical protein